jgi:MraZ protein
MTRFLGTHNVKLDKKGRISVPAPFRARLEAQGSTQIVLFRSFQLDCIECWPEPAFEQLAESHDRLDIFSAGANDLGASLFAAAQYARPDAEGRLVLPPDLVATLGLGEAVTILGANRSFQIWDAARAEAHLAEARERARAGNLTLPAPRPPGAAP